MLSNADLLANLTILESLYQSASTKPPAEQKQITKYALLELCGWIEEAQDHIVNGCIAKLIDADLIDLMNEKVKINSGFASRNFVQLLGLVVGLNSLEALRSNLIAKSANFQLMMSYLDSLKTPRNSHAHTHFSSTNAVAVNHLAGMQPLLVIGKANSIHHGFADLEAELAIEGFL